MKKIFSALQLFFLLFCIASINAQVPDLSGTWDGKIKDKTSMGNNNYNVDLSLYKKSETQYVGKMKVKKNYGLMVGVAIASGYKEFHGTFLVVGTVSADKQHFILSINKTITNSDKRITWCKIVPNFELNAANDEMNCKYYEGCIGGFGGYVALEGGKFNLKKTGTAIPAEDMAIINEQLTPQLEFGKFAVQKQNATSNKVEYGVTNYIGIPVTNKSSSDWEVKGNFEITAVGNPDLKVNLKHYHNPARLKPGATDKVWIAYFCPNRMEADSIRISAVFYDDDQNKTEITKLSQSLGVEKFLLQNAIIKTNPRSKIIQDYYSMTPGATNRKMFDESIKKGDSIAALWKRLYQNVNRGGLVNKGKSFEMNPDLYNSLKDKARNGDAEALYLFGMYHVFGLNSQYLNDGLYMINAAAKSGYLPAVCDDALMSLTGKDEAKRQQAINDLTNSYNKGNKRAAVILADIYSRGFFNKPDKKKAFEWFQKVQTGFDPEHNYLMGRATMNFRENDADIEKAELLARKGIQNGYTETAEDVGSSIAVIDRNNDATVNKGLKLLNEAAAAGDVNAMYDLGLMFISDQALGPKRKDVPTAFVWIKKSAEGGNPNAMELLGGLYSNGMAAEINVIKSRYWLTKAELAGLKVSKGGQPQEGFTADKFIDNIDLSARRRVEVYQNGTKVDEYNEGPGVGEAIFDAIADTYKQSRMQKQEFINGIEFIQGKDGRDVYGGTVSSSGQTGLFIKKGMQLKFKTTGFINFGAIAGTRNPDGRTSGMANYGIFKEMRESGGDMRGYNIIQEFPHGAFMVKIGNGAWKLIGSGQSFVATEEGNLSIAVNDNDYIGNSGYFDFELITK